jgi:hypothetical protein
MSIATQANGVGNLAMLSQPKAPLGIFELVRPVSTRGRFPATSHRMTLTILEKIILTVRTVWGSEEIYKQTNIHRILGDWAHQFV